jgi:predicted DNA-binding antitoxin AbrB/MazE fold protein
LAKTIRARFRQGHIEPLEDVDVPEGTELLVTFEEAAAANQWFKELHVLFAPVRKELRKERTASIDRRIARAVKAVRASKRG